MRTLEADKLLGLLQFVWLWSILWSKVDIWRDRKSTRLNSSHSQKSYAVFCLKKKNRPFIWDDNVKTFGGLVGDLTLLPAPTLLRFLQDPVSPRSLSARTPPVHVTLSAAPHSN